MYYGYKYNDPNSLYKINYGKFEAGKNLAIDSYDNK